MKTKVFTWITVGVTLVTLLAACAPASEPAVGQKLDELAGAVSNLQANVDSATGNVDAVEEQIAALEETVAQVDANLADDLLTRAEALPDPPPGKVTIQLAWSTSFGNLPAPITTYKPAEETNILWAMDSVPAGEPVPKGEEIKDGIVFLEPGEQMLVAVVLENPTDQNVQFIMVPHQLDPAPFQGLTWFQCGCMSILYEAPPNGAWYRVMGIGISPDVKPGTKLIATHFIIADPAYIPPYLLEKSS